jgi:ubiquinone/menaquinone biosynthesis C-methylase UbiE
MQISNELTKQANSAMTEQTTKLCKSESIVYDGRHYDLMYQHSYSYATLYSSGHDFWLDMAKRHGEPILELCCGTGRIGIPLAEAGFQVTGIDISASMLEEGRKRSNQVEWIQADVQSFKIHQQFSLIIFPLNSLGHLLNLDAVENCLSCVRKHLKPEGRFVIDLENYCNQDNLSYFLQPKTRNLFSIYPDPDGNGTIVVTEEGEFNWAEQVLKINFFFRVAGQEEETLEKMTLRSYFPQELKALLKLNGFEVEDHFGDYDRTPFTSQSPLNLLVCRL